MPSGDETDRAGVLVVRDRHIALIEREHLGRRYWVIPGGSVERGEAVEDAALREAREELGVGVTLGRLLIRIDHREHDGSIQRQWYFDASVDDDDIRVVGPELESGQGSYTAIWASIDDLDADRVLPAAVIRWLQELDGPWPTEPVVIDERP
jgi:8-oxo-dGTP pyrophosphatase MutT (NUDIX family)